MGRFLVFFVLPYYTILLFECYFLYDVIANFPLTFLSAVQIFGPCVNIHPSFIEWREISYHVQYVELHSLSAFPVYYFEVKPVCTPFCVCVNF